MHILVAEYILSVGIGSLGKEDKLHTIAESRDCLPVLLPADDHLALGCCGSVDVRIGKAVAVAIAALDFDRSPDEAPPTSSHRSLTSVP